MLHSPLCQRQGRSSIIRPSAKRSVARRIVTTGAVGVAIAMTGTLAVVAQPAIESSASILEGLRGCRALAGRNERVICYDAKVGALLGAVEAGDVRLVDREQVRKSRRQLFGLTLPDVDILKADAKEKLEEESSLFETTIATGRQIAPTSWRFTTIEGAVWEINNPVRRIAPLEPGDKVVFKSASLGYYFIRINGQIGVKGRRVG